MKKIKLLLGMFISILLLSCASTQIPESKETQIEGFINTVHVITSNKDNDFIIKELSKSVPNIKFKAVQDVDFSNKSYYIIIALDDRDNINLYDRASPLLGPGPNYQDNMKGIANQTVNFQLFQLSNISLFNESFISNRVIPFLINNELLTENKSTVVLNENSNSLESKTFLYKTLESIDGIKSIKVDPLWIYTNDFSDFLSIHKRIISVEPISTKGEFVNLTPNPGIILLTGKWEKDVDDTDFKDYINTLVDNELTFLQFQNSIYIIAKISDDLSAVEFLNNLDKESSTKLRNYIQLVKGTYSTVKEKETNINESSGKSTILHDDTVSLDFESLSIVDNNGNSMIPKIKLIPSNNNYKLEFSNDMRSSIVFEKSKVIGKIEPFSTDIIFLDSSNSSSQTPIHIRNSNVILEGGLVLIFIDNKVFNRPILVDVGHKDKDLNYRERVYELDFLNDDEKKQVIGLMHDFQTHFRNTLYLPMEPEFFESTKQLKQITKIEVDFKHVLELKRDYLELDTLALDKIDYKIYYDLIDIDNVNFASVGDLKPSKRFVNPTDEIRREFERALIEVGYPLGGGGGIGNIVNGGDRGTPLVIFSGKDLSPRGDVEGGVQYYFGKSQVELEKELQSNPFFYKFVEYAPNLPKAFVIAVRDAEILKDKLETDEEFKTSLKSFYSQKYMNGVPE